MASRRRWSEGDFDAAIALAEEGMTRSAADTALNWEARARAQMVLGNVILAGDGMGDAVEYFERVVACAEHSPVRSTAIVARQLLATALPNRGVDYVDAALAEAEASRRLALASGCPSLIALADFAIGYSLFMRDDPAAIEPLRRAAVADRGPNISGTLPLIALHEMRHGTPDEAFVAILEAVRYARSAGDHMMTSTVIDLTWPLLIRYGDPEAAATLVGSVDEGNVPHIRRTGVPGQGRDRALASLARRLSADELATCRRDGAAMTYEQIVQYALDRLEAAQGRAAAP